MIIKQPIYNGSFIHDRFAYKYWKKEVNPNGNIVAFRCPMDVTTNLIDLEDSLNDDYIKSDDAMNFCWEIPDLDPKGAVAFQRLFNVALGGMIHQLTDEVVTVEGDDIMVGDKKSSVSITYSKGGVAIGHTGINIVAGEEAPDFAYSTHLSDEQVNHFMQEAINWFDGTVADIFVATTKLVV